MTGCNDGGDPLSITSITPSDITVAPAAPQFAPSGPIVMRVVNAGGVEYDFNTCYCRLERAHGAGWVSFSPHDVCNASAQRLPPRSTVTGTLRVPDELPQGRYRFVTRFGYAVDGQPREQVQFSDTFAIGR